MKVWVIAPSAAGREVSDTPRQFGRKMVVPGIAIVGVWRRRS